MRLRNLPLVSGLILGLAISVVWCAGPCCGAMEANPVSAPSIGVMACCGAGTPSQCQPSIQSVDGAVFSSVAPLYSPLALLATQPTSAARVAREPGLTLEPRLLSARQSLPSLHVPLLI